MSSGVSRVVENRRPLRRPLKLLLLLLLGILLYSVYQTTLLYNSIATYDDDISSSSIYRDTIIHHAHQLEDSTVVSQTPPLSPSPKDEDDPQEQDTNTSSNWGRTKRSRSRASADDVDSSDASSSLYDYYVPRREELQQHQLLPPYWPTIPMDHYSHLVRVFPSWPTNSTSWCWRRRRTTTTMQQEQEHPDRTKDPELAGLIFQKNYKSASSTVAGIAIRISRSLSSLVDFDDSDHLELDDTEKDSSFSSSPSSSWCDVRTEHSFARFVTRDRQRTFMFSTIRDPTQRAISIIFYQATIQKTNPQFLSDEHIRQKLQQDTSLYFMVRNATHRYKMLNDPGQQLGFLSSELSPRPLSDIITTTTTTTTTSQTTTTTTTNNGTSIQQHYVHDIQFIQQRVQSVLDDYDFIIVVERLDESLVALQLLLNLNTRDILYVQSSKSSGSYVTVYSGWRGGRNYHPNCIPIKKKYIGPQTETYLQSSEWYIKNYGDYLLYKAVNQSLDVTIEQLGQERFERALKKFRTFQQMAKSICQNNETIIGPCSENGKYNSKTTCYKNDWGCGYPCLDRNFPPPPNNNKRRKPL